jgi:hypothetical protein
LSQIHEDVDDASLGSDDGVEPAEGATSAARRKKSIKARKAAAAAAAADPYSTLDAKAKAVVPGFTPEPAPYVAYFFLSMIKRIGATKKIRISLTSFLSHTAPRKPPSHESGCRRPARRRHQRLAIPPSPRAQGPRPRPRLRISSCPLAETVSAPPGPAAPPERAPHPSSSSSSSSSSVLLPAGSGPRQPRPGSLPGTPGMSL